MSPLAQHYEDRLLEFAYGELPDQEARAVEAHLRGCERCNSALGAIRGVRKAMARLPVEEPSDAGLESLMAYAAQAARRSAAGPAPQAAWWRRWMAPLAGVAALAVVGVVAYQVADQTDLSAATMTQKAAQKDRAPVAAAPAPPPAELAKAEPAQDKLANEEPQTELASAERSPAGKGDTLVWEPTPGAQQKAEEKVAYPNKESLNRRAAKIAADDAQAYGEIGSARKRQVQQKALEAKKPFKSFDEESQAPGRVAGNELKQDAIAGRTDSDVGAAQPAAPLTSNVGERAEAAKAGQAPPPTPVATVVANEPPSAYRDTAQASQASPQPQSMGLSLGSASTRSGGSGGLSSKPTARAAEGSPAPGVASSLGAGAYDEADAKKVKAVELSGLLAKARAAGQSGDRKQEISIAQRVLAAGATGSQRLEALTRLCRAFAAIEQEDLAQPYCAAVATEFPSSAAAKELEANSSMPRAKAAPSKKKKSKKGYQFEDELRAPEPAQRPMPADERPLQEAH